MPSEMCFLCRSDGGAVRVCAARQACSLNGVETRWKRVLPEVRGEDVRAWVIQCLGKRRADRGEVTRQDGKTRILRV